MPLTIPPLTSVSPAGHALPPVSPGASAATPGAFASMLDRAVQSVERPGREADSEIRKFLSGDGEDLHTVAIAAQKAEIAFDLGMQLRNKVVSAYQEIMKMQL